MILYSCVFILLFLQFGLRYTMSSHLDLVEERIQHLEGMVLGQNVHNKNNQQVMLILMYRNSNSTNLIIFIIAAC